MKRGFKTKREALEWERTFLQRQTADPDMTFESSVALYAVDMKLRSQRNISQIALAKQLGASKSVISSYENEIHCPPYDVLLQMASFPSE